MVPAPPCAAGTTPEVSALALVCGLLMPSAAAPVASAMAKRAARRARILLLLGIDRLPSRTDHGDGGQRWIGRAVATERRQGQCAGPTDHRSTTGRVDTAVGVAGVFDDIIMTRRVGGHDLLRGPRGARNRSIGRDRPDGDNLRIAKAVDDLLAPSKCPIRVLRAVMAGVADIRRIVGNRDV